jgi:hypothetical protein
MQAAVVRRSSRYGRNDAAFLTQAMKEMRIISGNRA